MDLPGEIVGGDHGRELVGSVDGDGHVVGVRQGARRQDVALRQTNTHRFIKLISWLFSLLM